jgi:hypothetical protein
MDNGESQDFLPPQKSRIKIAEIGSGRRGKSKILVQKNGVLTYGLGGSSRSGCRGPEE